MLCRIGAGAYGEVWLARNFVTRAERALKIVDRARFSEDRPFQREFEGIKRFDALSRAHPTQLTLFHVGKGDGFFYYVMELADPLPGSAEYRPHTLRNDLNNGRLPAAKVLDLGKTLAEALHHLHAADLVHRDVKPSNIIYVRGRAKLADIGLVTDVSDSRSIVGTEGYLAPEGPGAPQADLFALGKVLYEALTGLDRRHFPELPADIRQWPDAKLAFELNSIFLKAAAAHANERYQNAAALLADLEFLSAGKSVQKRAALRRILMLGAKFTALVILVWTVFTIPKQFGKSNQSQAQPFTFNTPFETSGTTNVDAWQASRRAIQMARTYTAEGLSNSIREYEQASTLDPNFSRAFSTRSICLSIAVENGFMRADQALPLARECAERAIQINPNAGGPYCALAFATLPVDHDFPKAEALLRKSIALSPDNWTLRSNFAHILVYQRRFLEAAQILEEIIRAEPNEAMPLHLLGLSLSARGEPEHARVRFDQAIRLEAGRPSLYLSRAEFLWFNGDRSAAALDYLRFVELGGLVSLDKARDSAALRKILNDSTPENFLAALAQLLEERAASGAFVTALELARFYAALGDSQRALDSLEKAIPENRFSTFGAATMPAFRNLQDNPRFQACLARLSLK